MRAIAVFIAFLFQCAPPARADLPIFHGGEFEISTPEMMASYGKTSRTFEGGEGAARERFVALVREKCRALECVVGEAETGKHGQPEYQVTLKNGWWFRISMDPWVIEIQTKPSTLDELREVKSEANALIFDIARDPKNGFTIPKEHLASHHNTSIIGLFGTHSENFLRFFSDYSNHPELALGTLGKDLQNNPPVTHLLERHRRALAQIVEEFHDGKLPTVKDIVREVVDRVYLHSAVPQWGNPHHYQAMSFYKALWPLFPDTYDVPFELRPIWAHHDMEEFILAGELVELRAAYLEKNRIPTIFIDEGNRHYSPSELLARYYVYVTEAGGDFEKFKKLLPEDLQKLEVPRFFREKMNWNDVESRKWLANELRRISHSAFSRERVREALVLPESVNEHGVAMLDSLFGLRAAAVTPRERAIYDEFLGGIFARGPWNRYRTVKHVRGLSRRQPWDVTDPVFSPMWRTRSFVDRCRVRLRALASAFVR